MTLLRGPPKTSLTSQTSFPARLEGLGLGRANCATLFGVLSEGKGIYMHFVTTQGRRSDVYSGHVVPSTLWVEELKYPKSMDA